MSRTFRTSAVVVVLAFAALPALAQNEPPPPSPGGTEPGGPTTIVTRKARVTFSGKLDLTLAYKSEEMFTATKGNGLDSTGNLPYLSKVDHDGNTILINDANRAGGSTIPRGSEFYLDPNLVLNFSVDVGDKASGVFELRTPFVNPDAGGKNSTPGTGFFSNTQNRTLEVKKLYIQLDELFAREKDQGLLIRAGIMDFRKDFAETGNPFVIDTAGTEHPFDSPTGVPVAASTGFADSTEAAGGYLLYRVSIFDIDAWGFNIDQTFNSDGWANAVLFWGGSASLYFDADKKWGKVFGTVFDLQNDTGNNLPTEGFGVVVNPIHTQKTNLLSMFAEFYFQQGQYASEVFYQNDPAAAFFQKVKQNAYALQLGAKGKLPPEAFGENIIPYAEVSYVQVSGDDDVNGKNKNFVSLENNNRTVVVENGYYGYDVDTNYRGPRLALGTSVYKFSFEVLYAYFELMENGGNRISGGGSKSNKIGDEIDISIGYEYSPALKFGLQTGWLMDSHALGQLAATNVTLFTMSLEF
jgi:hypothetical protein